MWTISPNDSSLKVFAEKLYNVIKNTEDIILMVPLEKMSLDNRLREDLGLDSIQTVSIFYELEETYPLLQEEMVAEWRTIRDILKSMEGSR